MQEQYGRDRSRTKDVTGQVSVIRHHSASWGPLSASVDWVLDTPAATTGASDETRIRDVGDSAGGDRGGGSASGVGTAADRQVAAGVDAALQ